MTERERLRLHGPVRIVRSEFGQWNPQAGDWDLRPGPTWTFDREGHLEGRPREEPPTRSTVDEKGRRTTIGPHPPSIPRPHGMEYGLGIDGRQRVDFVTRYDTEERPVEVEYRDADRRVLHHILIAYDERGRVVHERVLLGEGGIGSFGADASGVPASAEERAAMVAMLTAVMPDRVFMTIEYVYDDRSRVARRTMQMGTLSEERQTYVYDDRDNVVEEYIEHSDRELGVRGDTVIATEKSRRESWSRYEYRYDEAGNWIERIVVQRLARDAEFRRTSIERRTITYVD